ncbi:MAG: hypothetical protein JJ916_04000 [Phycisphaerales bacterium]|nr:hypothetical protein [Phycisphaerales bacterium]
MNELTRRADDLIERHIGARTPLSQETIEVLRELRDAAEPDLSAPHYTLTQRERVAMELRVPESGTDWIDEMIRKSRRDRLIEASLAGFSANPGSSEWSYEQAAEYSIKQADEAVRFDELAGSMNYPDGKPEGGQA